MPTKLSISLARSLSNLPRTNNTNKMDQSTLVLSQIIFRHGHRSPDQKLNYPGDPYVNEAYLPFGRGELTLIGRKQCYAFGQSLRQRYSKFLGPDYVNGIIDAKASEIQRARTTLQLVLAGLFPPTSSTKIDDQLNWQPIPFTYKTFKDDELIGRAVSNMYQHEDHPNFGKTTNSQEVIKVIQNDLKWDVKVQAQCLLLFDTLKTQIDIGLEMPKWCASIFPQKLEKECQDFSAHNFARKDFVVNGMGHLIKEINEVMLHKLHELEETQGIREKIGEESKVRIPKMYLYSGHDINIIGLLSIFKQFDATKWPNYMANITVELHKMEGEYFVRMLYQDGPKNARNFSTEQENNALRLPGIKEDYCKLSQFTDYVKEYFPSAPKL